MHQPISELTRAMSAGSVKAIEEFYREYFPQIYRTARRITGRDESFGLDVVQEAMLRILRCIKPIENQQHLNAWLDLVVKSTAYDLLKAEARRQKREQTAVQCRQLTVGIVPATASGGDEANDRLVWLRQQLSQFDPDLAQMIDLRYQQSWTLDRMAEFLGLSIATIDGRLRRAINRLKKAAISQGQFEEITTSIPGYPCETIRPAINGGGSYDR